jgi:hypothetical protein
MSTTNLTIYDATPSVDDGVIPVEFSKRTERLGEFSSASEWVRQTLAFRRVAERYGFDAGSHSITVRSGPIGIERLRPPFAAAGVVCCVYLTFPCPAESQWPGTGNTSVVGLSADGCRAIVHEAAAPALVTAAD